VVFGGAGVHEALEGLFNIAWHGESDTSVSSKKRIFSNHDIPVHFLKNNAHFEYVCVSCRTTSWRGSTIFYARAHKLAQCIFYHKTKISRGKHNFLWWTILCLRPK
jgi:hypothetical protein